MYPVQNEKEIKEFLVGLKKEHPTANHHCYAYILGANKQNVRANDDGEPSYTAGKPILGQIQSFDLTNVLVVVVRYFGGTLLGVSGLISAYKNSAHEVLKISNKTEKQIQFYYTIKFPYLQLNDIMKTLKHFDCYIEKQQFDLDCEIRFSVRKSTSELCEEKLKKIDDLTLKCL